MCTVRTGHQDVLPTTQQPRPECVGSGFFASLQSILAKEETRNRQVLVQAVRARFVDYPHEKLNRVFLTLQMAMQQVILCSGGNDYKLQHMNKMQLEQNGALPLAITASEEVLEKIANN